VLSCDGRELARNEARTSFLLRCGAETFSVDAAGARLEVKESVREGPWSELASLPEATGLTGVAVGPHVRVSLAVRRLDFGDELTVHGRESTRAADGAADYRAAAAGRRIEADRIERARSAAPPPRQPRGLLLPLGLAGIAFLALLVVPLRLLTAHPLEVWAWSGWWALIAMGTAVATARRYGHVHLFPSKPVWFFVPHFAEVRAKAQSASADKTPGVRLFGAGLVGNLACTLPYLLVFVFTSTPEPADVGTALPLICLFSGLLNHGLAWLWLYGRMRRSRAHAQRLLALTGNSSAAWTIRGASVQDLVRREVDVEVHVHRAGRSTYTEQKMSQRWLDRMARARPEGADPFQVSLEGAWLAGEGELVSVEPGPPEKLCWRFEMPSRWLIGHSGAPRGQVASEGPETLLGFAAADPGRAARSALLRRKAQVVVLVLAALAGVASTGLYALARALL